MKLFYAPECALRSFVCSLPHTIIAAILLVTGTLPLPALAGYQTNFPLPVTPLARDTLHVHNLFMLIISLLFIIVFAIMCYAMFMHRKSTGHKAATFTGPQGKLQWLWTLVPFAILLFIDYVIFGVPAYHAVLAQENTRNNADMVIKITGLQWKWQYEYPSEGIKFISTSTTPRQQITGEAAKDPNYLISVDNPLVVPVGKKIRVITSSTDVIHSWWVPAFGIKRDAIPGFLREFWIQVEVPGEYHGQCAELCGKDHAFMPVVVHAVPPDEYTAWVAKQKIALAGSAAGAAKTWSMDELKEAGSKVYEKNCLACHQADGKGIPNVFPGLANSKMVNSPWLDATGTLIKDGHVDRVMHGKAGTAMQAFASTLSATDIAAVVTYERNAFGNQMGDMVQPSQIQALMPK